MLKVFSLAQPRSSPIRVQRGGRKARRWLDRFFIFVFPVAIRTTVHENQILMAFDGMADVELTSVEFLILLSTFA